MGSSKATTQSSNTNQSTTDPWAPQAAALQTVFDQSGDALAKSQQAVAPTQFTAQMTPAQLAAFQSQANYGSNTSTAGTADAGTALTGAGVQGVTGALSGLNNFDPTAGNNTQSVINAATQYANNPAIDGQVQAAMRDATQNVRDVQLPGIGSAAALTGNTNSSRTGVREGLVERALAQQTADTSANLRGAAYNQGLTLAEQQQAGNNATALAALQGAGSLGNAAANSGVGASTQAITNQGALNDITNAGNAAQQANTQLGLDNQAQQYASASSSPYDALAQYMKLIGSQSYGSSTTGSGTGNSTTTSTPSAWQVIGGLMGAGGSLAKGLSGF